MRFQNALVLLAAAAVQIEMMSANAREPYFIGLGGGSVDDISYDGSVVVGGSSGGVYRWTRETGMVGLGPADAAVQRVSGDGSTVIVYGNTLWSTEKGLFNLPSQFVATDLSGDGSVVCGYANVDPTAFDTQAVRWTQGGGLEYLPRPVDNHNVNVGFGISADGSIVLGNSYTLPDGPPDNTLIIWSAAEGLVTLNLPSPLAGDREFTRLSDNGKVATGIMGAGADRRGFRWTKQTGAVDVGRLPDGLWMSATAVSGDGSIIVGNSQNVSPQRPAIWDAMHGPRYLDDLLANELGLQGALAGWSGMIAENISGDGRTIAGRGVNPQGNTEVWLAFLGSPPGLAGDYDGNAIVDGADFLKWQRGESPEPNTPADLAEWKANFGAGAVESAGKAVPEPTTGWLALAVAGIASLRAHRFRSAAPI